MIGPRSLMPPFRRASPRRFGPPPLPACRHRTRVPPPQLNYLSLSVLSFRASVYPWSVFMYISLRDLRPHCFIKPPSAQTSLSPSGDFDLLFAKRFGSYLREQVLFDSL